MAWGAVCVLEVAVRVSHGCNQIFLSAMGSKGVEMIRVWNQRQPNKGARQPTKASRKRSANPTWRLANAVSCKKFSRLRFGLRDYTHCKIYEFLSNRNATTASFTPVPFSLYKWRQFGFDGSHNPVWTIQQFLKREWMEQTVFKGRVI